MNKKVAITIIVAVAGVLLTGFLVFRKSSSRSSVTTTLHISVTPKEQLEFVVGKVNSPYFKYRMAKAAGVKSLQAQQLKATVPPNSSFLEAKIALMTPDEAQRYANAFIAELQDVCGKEIQLNLAEQSVR
jgi:capsular polysaccharide biosynthesis protein